MRRLLLPGTAFVLVVTACGAGASPAPRLSNVAAHTRPSLHAIAAARKLAAGHEAQKLLRRVPLPRGARPIRKTPVLGQGDRGVSLLNELAWRDAFWRVRMPLESVYAFVKAHPLPGFTYYGGGGLYRSLDFETGRGGASQRLLTVSVARDAGWTDVRVDAGVAWIYPRSPREVVPVGVREIDIRDGHLARRVTDSPKVERIARWFDALNVVPPDVHVECPLILASRITLTFRSADGARLATARLPSRSTDACDPIAFSIRGRRQAPLVDATFGKHAFVNRVERLLGVCFPDARRACR